MTASVDAATIVGARGHAVTVEVHVSKGLPAFTMLGLPDESCREARDRVRAAITSAGFTFPDKKVVVNLAPPQFRKSGSGLDVAIAIGVLVATDVVVPEAIRGLAFAGELGLDGSVRTIPGVAPMVGVRPDHDWVVPAGCVAEARVAGRGIVRPVDELRALVDALNGVTSWPQPDHAAVPSSSPSRPTWQTCVDNRWPAWHSRWQPQEGTICCSSAHPERARRCWRGGSPACYPTSNPMLPCRRPWCTRPQACNSPPVDWCGGRRSGRHTTRVRSVLWSVAVGISSAPAKSRWRMAASCFWMRWGSSSPERSTGCARRSSPGRSWSVASSSSGSPCRPASN